MSQNSPHRLFISPVYIYSLWLCAPCEIFVCYLCMYIAVLLVYLVLCICVYRFCLCFEFLRFQPVSGFLFLSCKSGPCIFIFLCLLVFSIFEFVLPLPVSVLPCLLCCLVYCAVIVFRFIVLVFDLSFVFSPTTPLPRDFVPHNIWLPVFRPLLVHYDSGIAPIKSPFSPHCASGSSLPFTLPYKTVTIPTCNT